MSNSDSLFDILDCNDLEEFKYLRTIQRYNFEQNNIKWNSHSFQTHLSYGRFELEIAHNLDRFRNVLERFISRQNSTQISISFWLQYIDMEIRYGNYNHARNLFKRSIKINSGTSMFVLYTKYVELEHLLLQTKETESSTETIMGIFKEWKTAIYPNDKELLNEYYKVYLKYIMLYNVKDDLEFIRSVFIEWFIMTKSFTNWADFEIHNNKKIEEVRAVFDLIIDELPKDKDISMLLSALTKYIFFELKAEEDERARALFNIYREYSGTDNIDLGLKTAMLSIANRRLETSSSEQKNLGYFQERSLYYKQESETQLLQLAENSYNKCYSFWSEYSDYLESVKDLEQYELLLEQLKPVIDKDTKEKSTQLRICIKIWLKYLDFVKTTPEIANKWDELVNFVQGFTNLTFKKVWMGYLTFLEGKPLWQDTFRMVVASYGKPSIFKALISTLYSANKFDEIRFVYDSFIAYNPVVSETWSDYVKLETMLQDAPRVRCLYSSIIDFFLEINEPVDKFFSFILNSLKDFVQFETGEGEYSYVRKNIWGLYLLNSDPASKNIKLFKDSLQAWVDCAYWELKSPTEEQLLAYENEEDEQEIQLSLTEANKNNCRDVFEAGLVYFKGDYNKKLALLQQFISFEKTYGSDSQLVADLERRLPVDGVFVDDDALEEISKLDNLMNLVEAWDE